MDIGPCSWGYTGVDWLQERLDLSGLGVKFGGEWIHVYVRLSPFTVCLKLLLLLLSCFSRVRLCDPIDGSPPGSSVLGFSRQEHWSGLPFPSPMHESEKWKWSCSVNSQGPHGMQPTRLLHPWDFPGKSTGVGCHFLLQFKALFDSNLLDAIGK